MSGAIIENTDRWIFGLRVIPNVVRRAQLRSTLTYRLHPRLSAGIEVNPRADTAAGRVSPLLNWLAITETENRPALIVGTSSDRIGTPEGQSLYATLSKNLRRETGLPIAPYAGAAYSTHEHRWLGLAGLNVYFPRDFSSQLIFDGVRLHPILSYTRGRHVVSFVLAFSNKPGFSYSVGF